MTDYIPPVGFYYTVHILKGNKSSIPPPDAASFQEVSGISVTMETEQIQEGGENRFTHRIPGRTNYEDLVLRRGLMVRSSALADWCTKTFKNNLSGKIEPKNIMVSLLSASTNSRQATMTWKFFNAYPVKWDISSMDTQKSEIVVESITFAYQYFEKVD